MYKIYALIYLAFLCNGEVDATKECNFVRTDTFTNCSSGYDYEKKQPTNSGCVDEDICRRTFTLTGTLRQTFYGTLNKTLRNMLFHCCGTCAKIHVRDLNFSSEVNASSIKYSDFVFPVLGEYQEEKYHGHYFIPIFNIPTSYYFTIMKSQYNILVDVVDGCLGLWPLLVICLLAAGISGFIAWSLETRVNPTEFPRMFHLGLFEGFWWSFVSMTTVGYGDKSPKSFLGRLFAIFWIIVGITICSMLTASLTTVVINARTLSEQDMSGKTVGCLNYRLNDVKTVAENGGIAYPIDYTSTWKGIGELLELLERGVIDGFLLNKQTYYQFLRLTKNKPQKYYKEAALSNRIHLFPSEKTLKQGRLMFGLLVKDYTDYKYFRAFFKNNRLDMQTCHSIRMNKKKTSLPEYKIDIFSSNSYLFRHFLYSLLGILAVITLFGGIYECVKQRDMGALNLHSETEIRLT